MTTPYLLEDEIFLDTLNRQLKDKYSFLITKKGEEIVYVGDEEKFLAIQDNIYLCGSYNTEVDGGVYVGGKSPFLIKQQEFICSDGTTAVIFVITDINNVVPQIKEFAIQAVISFILIIMITAIILVLWLYRSIIRPMNILKRATKEMKEGNLDYSIRMQTFDEIGELCDDFEEMRIHLKELIEVKMQYETNSRELLSNISHDLKTPLTTIKGYAEGIIDGVADSPEKLDRYIRTIYTKANDMSALVDELSM
jgi:signal transduction histidine kinase